MLQNITAQWSKLKNMGVKTSPSPPPLKKKHRKKFVECGNKQKRCKGKLIIGIIVQPSGPLLRQVEEEDVDDPDEDDEDVGDAGGDEDNSEDEDYKAPDSGSFILLNGEEQMRGGRGQMPYFTLHAECLI